MFLSRGVLKGSSPWTDTPAMSQRCLFTVGVVLLRPWWIGVFFVLVKEEFILRYVDRSSSLVLRVSEDVGGG